VQIEPGVDLNAAARDAAALTTMKLRQRGLRLGRRRLRRHALWVQGFGAFFRWRLG
jgi:hypothetical protein